MNGSPAGDGEERGDVYSRADMACEADGGAVGGVLSVLADCAVYTSIDADVQDGVQARWTTVPFKTAAYAGCGKSSAVFASLQQLGLDTV